MLAPVKTPLLVLLGGALLLLAMACANIAGFLVGDAASGSQEMRVRTALGAGRGRLVRQLLVESGLLAAAGGTGCFLVGAWGVRALVALGPASVPRLPEVAFDLRALAFAVAAAALTALLSGTLPTFMLSRSASAAAAPGSTRVTGHRRVQGRLLVVQLATGVTLLAGAGLFVRTLQNLNGTDVGFTRGHLLTARWCLPLPLNRRQSSGASISIARRRRLRSCRAWTRRRSPRAWRLRPAAPARPSHSPRAHGAGRVRSRRSGGWCAEFFRVMEVPLVAGRIFATSDTERTDTVAVVSREMARRFWPDGAIGQHFTRGTVRHLVVGVVGDVRDQTLATEPMATFYLSTSQLPASPTMRLVMRTRVPPSSLAVVPSGRRSPQSIRPSRLRT